MRLQELGYEVTTDLVNCTEYIKRQKGDCSTVLVIYPHEKTIEIETISSINKASVKLEKEDIIALGEMLKNELNNKKNSNKSKSKKSRI